MTLRKLACSPLDDDVVVIDDRRVVSTLHGWVHDAATKPVAVVFGGDTLVVLDERGGVQLLAALTGESTGASTAGGKPVDVAVSDDAIAVAREDRIVILRGEAREEVLVRANAIAFGPPGFAYVNRDGAFTFAKEPIVSVPITVAAPIALLPLPSGEWLIATRSRVSDFDGARATATAIEDVVVDPVGGRFAVLAGGQLDVYALADRDAPPQNISLLTPTVEGLGVTRSGDLVFGAGGGTVVRITPGAAATGAYEVLAADAEAKKERPASDIWVLALVGGFVLLLGVIAYLALRHGV